MRIGTSGWDYPHWRGVFYPEHLSTGEWLSYYSRTFSTVEVNYSFYRLPSPGTFERWRERVPPDFAFAVKASRYLTHMKKLSDIGALDLFLARARILGGKLGPVLYQLPRNFRANPDRLRAFAEALPPDVRHVVEFRHPSWLSDEIFGILREHSMAYCITSLDAVAVTAPFAYIRMHGGERGPNYEEEELARWAEAARALPEPYIYFNNDLMGYAPANARRLIELLG
ncbi:MAG: DUF72 domain-containing protein [Armatimonadota bacterium]